MVAVCALGAAAAPAAASIPPPGVPNANHRVGHPANKIAPGFTLTKIAQGSNPLENPSGLITKFGFLNDGSTQPVEPTKTEPDQNTYLVFKHGLPGPTHGLRLRHALPVPAARALRGRPRLRHAHQPRRDRPRTPDHAPDAGRRGRAHAPERARRHHLGSVHAHAPRHAGGWKRRRPDPALDGLAGEATCA